jgi:hypothetical protein
MGMVERKKPGIKAGGPNPGGFKKGEDSRRHVGAPWEVRKRDFGQMCKEYTPGAIDKLNAIIEDDTASNRDRLSAIELLVSHAVGTPVSRVVHASVTGGETPAGLSTDALDRLIASIPLEE